MNKLVSLLDQFNIPGGRYTYFPFHSKWNNSLSKKEWISRINTQGRKSVDVYVHIPFCHSLCTFCGCNIKIMKSDCDNQVYLERIRKEWSYYTSELKVEHLYLGGGTPNFLSPKDLEKLIHFFNFDINPMITIEIDPRFITKDDLNLYAQMGITHLSFGIQDFNQEVLENVNRVQDTKKIIELINHATSLNFKNINLDFIYGLNYQDKKTLEETFLKLSDLKATSLSLYPFAKVPWQNNSQKAFGEMKDFTLHEMNELFVTAYEIIQKFHFNYIGMGYFSKQESHDRNIMGFVKKSNDILIGLGVSSISSAPFGYIQNEKVYGKYLQDIKEDHFSVFKSHLLQENEYQRGIFFKNIIKNQLIDKKDFQLFKLNGTEEKIKELIKAEILIETDEALEITETGRLFHKAIFQSFDPNFLMPNYIDT